MKSEGSSIEGNANKNDAITSSEPATLEDFGYVYELCEVTMRRCVETDLGDCFERIAQPTIRRLLTQGLFKKIRSRGSLVGVIAFETRIDHIQLEEIYVEPSRQSEGIGTQVVKQLLADAELLDLPVRLHMLRSNRARTFYERLGFVVTLSTAQVHHMERRCPGR